MSGLSAEQVESLATFQSVTSIESEDEARRRLEAASWDLQIAVEHFLSGASASDPVRGVPVPAPSAPPPSTRSEGERSLATASGGGGQPHRRGRWRGFFRVIFFPIWLVMSIASFISEHVSRFVRGPPAIDYEPHGSESQNFLSRFERFYSSSHPAFFDGTFAEALSAAEARFQVHEIWRYGDLQGPITASLRRQFCTCHPTLTPKIASRYSLVQFLLVFLHSEVHPISVDFCRRVLTAADLIRFIDEDFIFWGRRVTSPEGHGAQDLLGVTTFPFLAIVRSLRGRPHGQTLSVLEGRTDADAVRRWLRAALDRYGGSLTAARAESEERDQTRLLREQQDREYHETLEADRRREQEKRDAEKRAAEEELERQRLEAEEKRKLEELAERRREKASALAEQPEKGPGVTSIVLRLPDGTRVDRRFRIDDRVSTIFDWADIQGVSMEHAALVTSFPRKSLLYPEDAERTIEEAGLAQGTMLLIEERVET